MLALKKQNYAFKLDILGKARYDAFIGRNDVVDATHSIMTDTAVVNKGQALNV